MPQIYGNQSKSYLEQLVQNALNSFKAFAYEKITVDATVKSLTIPDGARYAQMVLESSIVAPDNAARYLLTKTTAVSSAEGFPLPNGSVIDVTDYANLQGFQITRVAAGTTYLYVQYYK